jgi:hypothetical protein
VTGTETTPFQRLVKMIEVELELAGAGRVKELQDAVAKTGAYMATLQSPAPLSALTLVHRAQAMRARVTIEAQRLGESIQFSRATARRARLITKKYAQKQGTRYSTSA